MNDLGQSGWLRLLMILGLLLVGVLLLLLLSGALTPAPSWPPPATPVQVPRATIPGLMEGSGPPVNPQEGQEAR